MTPPRKPGALTLATLSRLAGRVVCGLALVWMLALVGWPERHERLGFVQTPKLFALERAAIEQERATRPCGCEDDPLCCGAGAGSDAGPLRVSLEEAAAMFELPTNRVFAREKPPGRPFWIEVVYRDDSPAVILGKLGR